MKKGNNKIPDLLEHLESCISLTGKSADFLISGFTEVNPFIDSDKFMKWFEKKNKQHCEVTKIPLDEIAGWYFEEDTGNLKHKSGKFFSIEGISVETNSGSVHQWSQPIINQPEIGILGILTKKFDGILYFLMQAKVEPGNINKVQLSPTVQATMSNYSRVHKGKATVYLEYFVDRKRSKVLLDQLQSEQGGRFLKKRNRNIMVEVPENEDIRIEEDFCWLTLGQIKKLLRNNNIVNMDTRTVISCIHYLTNKNGLLDNDINSIKECLYNSPVIESTLSDYQSGLLRSAMEADGGVNKLDDIRSWFTNLKAKYHLNIKNVPLNNLEKWKRDRYCISHDDGNFFRVIGVSVKTERREVEEWCQPLIEHVESGMVGFVIKKINGVYHFLVQAKVEPGNFDILEMAPTVQCITGSYRNERPENQPKYLDMFLKPDMSKIRYHAFQSEEGGRFYQELNEYMIIEVVEEFPMNIPDNYMWMTLGQITEFIKYNNYLNVEARSLISCLSFI